MKNSRLMDVFLKKEFLSVALIVIISIAFSIANPAFFAMNNLIALLRVSVMPAIFALGVMVVLIGGGIDFSHLWLGMFAAYTTSKVFSMLQMNDNIVAPLAAIFLMSILIGAGLGAFNALLASKLGVPTFIATLCSANIMMGVMLRYIGNEYIFPAEMPIAMINFSNAHVFTYQTAAGATVGLHVSVLITVALMLITHYILRYTMIGRSVFALGGDIISAQRIGVSLAKTRFFMFMYAGMLYGLGAAITVSKIQVANPYDFQGRELTIIAAVIIGGTKIIGGGGSVMGVALGVLLTNLISQNLIMIGVRPEFNRFVFGVLIVVAIVVQAIQEKIRNKGRV